MDIFKFKKLGLFAGGVLFGTAGIKILSSADAKKAYTNCTAAVLRAKDCVMKTAETVQENAGDILAEAKHINEERILNILDDFDGSDLSVGNSIYVTTKYALARWARRVSASWAANGVRINTVAPGNVSTPMTATMSENAKAALAALPIPINYGTDELMHPEDIANVIVFLVSPLAHGINGNVMFVDGGTDALLNSEKVY